MSALAQSLETLVLALPNVVTVYANETALTRSARELVGSEVSRIEVSMSDALPERITVNIGVDAAAQAPATAAAVAAAIRATLPPGSTTEIVVRISSVRGQ